MGVSGWNTFTKRAPESFCSPGDERRARRSVALVPTAKRLITRCPATSSSLD
ncbi:hypothetical protein [Agreia sp.]|uniref:hypothetical protein n=1 Tax=Agreia sp. TaxID=1872416 RepID=UPI0035BC976A